jgi:hypothetical protein
MPLEPIKVDSHKRRSIFFIVFVLLFLAIFPAAVFYSLGYRVTKDFKIVATGGITLHEVPDDAQVFVNYQEADAPNIFRRSFFIPDILPGTYLVVVAKAGHWSWAKKLEVKQKQVTSASVFLLPQRVNAEPIHQFNAKTESRGGFAFFSQATTTDKVVNSDYQKVNDLFTQKTTVVESIGLIYPATTTSEFRQVKISLNKKDRSMMSAWTAASSTVPDFFCKEDVAHCVRSMAFSKYTEDDPVSSFAFYPDRSDVIILKKNSGLYAVEIDQREEQNIQPIYLGSDIDFRIDGTKLYIKEAGHYFSIRL